MNLFLCTSELVTCLVLHSRNQWNCYLFLDKEKEKCEDEIVYRRAIQIFQLILKMRNSIAMVLQNSPQPHKACPQWSCLVIFPSHEPWMTNFFYNRMPSWYYEERTRKEVDFDRIGTRSKWSTSKYQRQSK